MIEKISTMHLEKRAKILKNITLGKINLEKMGKLVTFMIKLSRNRLKLY
jgi:hypothetical protein